MASSEKILVIDDDPSILKMLHALLTGSGYSADLASGSAEAHQKLSDSTYGVILLDAKLPGMSGLELLKYCRNLCPETEIIMITGNPELEDAIRTVKDGAFDYIAKPFSSEKLLARIDDALHHRDKRAASITDDTAVSDSCGNTNNSTLPLDGYEYLRCIGTGQMGVVALVEHNGNQYAMKLLRKAENDALTRERVGRFIREVEILETLSHPNIVKIYKCGFSSGGIPYVLMEYVDGKPLSSIITSGQLGIKAKFAIMRALADAIACVHAKGVLHRDIKPGNVLVTRDGIPKLTDFGIAKISNSSLTLTHEVLGSPAYMPPEAFRHGTELTVRSDLFSLGVTFYELLTSTKPFRAETVPQMMDAVINSSPRRPDKKVAGLPQGTAEMLEKLLNKNPADRYASADELVKDLDSIMDGTFKSSKSIGSKILELCGLARHWS